MEFIIYYLLWFLSGLGLMLLVCKYLHGEKGVLPREDIGMSIYFSLISGHAWALFLVLIWLTNEPEPPKQQPMEWIKTSDRLPQKDYPDVIVRIFSEEDGESEYTHVGFYDCNGWHSDLIEFDSDLVTHWMPLPEPPKN